MSTEKSILNDISQLRNLAQDWDCTTKFCDSFELVIDDLISHITDHLRSVSKKEDQNEIQAIVDDIEDVGVGSLNLIRGVVKSNQKLSADQEKRINADMDEILLLISDLSWNIKKPDQELPEVEADSDEDEEPKDSPVEVTEISGKNSHLVAEINKLKASTQLITAKALKSIFEMRDKEAAGKHALQIAAFLRPHIELVESPEEKGDFLGLLEDFIEGVGRLLSLAEDIAADITVSDLQDEMEDVTAELEDLFKLVSAIPVFDFLPNLPSSISPEKPEVTPKPVATLPKSEVPVTIVKQEIIQKPQTPQSSSPASTPGPTSSSTAVPGSTQPQPVPEKVAPAPESAPVPTRTRNQGPIAQPKPVIEKKVEVVSSSSSETESDESYSDDSFGSDDEDMAAQRAEFAAMFGISLHAMVDSKADEDFYNAFNSIQSLVNKCVVASFKGSHATRFIHHTLSIRVQRFVGKLREHADSLISANSKHGFAWFDFAEAVEDSITDLIKITRALYRTAEDEPLREQLKTSTQAMHFDTNCILDDLSSTKESEIARRNKPKDPSDQIYEKPLVQDLKPEPEPEPIPEPKPIEPVPEPTPQPKPVEPPKLVEPVPAPPKPAEQNQPATPVQVTRRREGAMLTPIVPIHYKKPDLAQPPPKSHHVAPAPEWQRRLMVRIHERQESSNRDEDEKTAPEIPEWQKSFLARRKQEEELTKSVAFSEETPKADSNKINENWIKPRADSIRKPKGGIVAPTRTPSPPAQPQSFNSAVKPVHLNIKKKNWFAAFEDPPKAEVPEPKVVPAKAKKAYSFFGLTDPSPRQRQILETEMLEAQALAAQIQERLTLEVYSSSAPSELEVAKKYAFMPGMSEELAPTKRFVEPSPAKRKAPREADELKTKDSRKSIKFRPSASDFLSSEEPTGPKKSPRKTPKKDSEHKMKRRASKVALPPAQIELTEPLVVLDLRHSVLTVSDTVLTVQEPVQPTELVQDVSQEIITTESIPLNPLDTLLVVSPSNPILILTAPIETTSEPSSLLVAETKVGTDEKDNDPSDPNSHNRSLPETSEPSAVDELKIAMPEPETISKPPIDPQIIDDPTNQVAPPETSELTQVPDLTALTPVKVKREVPSYRQGYRIAPISLSKFQRAQRKYTRMERAQQDLKTQVRRVRTGRSSSVPPQPIPRSYKLKKIAQDDLEFKKTTSFNFFFANQPISKLTPQSKSENLPDESKPRKKKSTQSRGSSARPKKLPSTKDNRQRLHSSKGAKNETDSAPTEKNTDSEQDSPKKESSRKKEDSSKSNRVLETSRPKKPKLEALESVRTKKDDKKEKEARAKTTDDAVIPKAKPVFNIPLPKAEDPLVGRAQTARDNTTTKQISEMGSGEWKRPDVPAGGTWSRATKNPFVTEMSGPKPLTRTQSVESSRTFPSLSASPGRVRKETSFLSSTPRGDRSTQTVRKDEQSKSPLIKIGTLQEFSSSPVSSPRNSPQANTPQNSPRATSPVKTRDRDNSDPLQKKPFERLKFSESDGASSPRDEGTQFGKYPKRPDSTEDPSLSGNRSPRRMRFTKEQKKEIDKHSREKLKLSKSKASSDKKTT